MGEVYRARDTKLNRDVALKILSEVFALDVDRLARFTREAQVLASVNHSNIAAIYGLETGPAIRTCRTCPTSPTRPTSPITAAI
jgi:serine/threonine-protein kinase